MVVVVIIGLLAGIALPALQRARQNTQNYRVINDLRIARAGFDTYSLQNGGWPPDGGTSFPPEMSAYLPPTFWNRSLPIGGNWSWGMAKYGVTAAVAINGSIATDAQMLEIDIKCDDGNLTTGSFRKSGSDFLYVMEP